MIVDLQSLSRTPRHFNLTFQPGWWRKNEGDEQVQGLEGPLVAQVSVSREGDRYVVNGRFTGKLSLFCDRCLDVYTLELSRDFDIDLWPPLNSEPVREEMELKKEDLSVGFITADKIDLDDIIREQIYLSLPIKLLCGSDCAGLCSRCGVNLNRETCKCSEGGGHPAFMKLKELTIR